MFPCLSKPGTGIQLSDVSAMLWRSHLLPTCISDGFFYLQEAVSTETWTAAEAISMKEQLALLGKAENLCFAPSSYVTWNILKAEKIFS